MEAGLKQNKIDALSAPSRSFKMITESLYKQSAANTKAMLLITYPDNPKTALYPTSGMNSAKTVRDTREMESGRRGKNA